MPTESNNDIFTWSDGMWIYRDELDEYSAMPNAQKEADATVLFEDTQAFTDFLLTARTN